MAKYGIINMNFFGLLMLAPSLLEFGTEEQKKEFLPKILSGEYTFVQAWSEPNAGSDLASLTTRAVLDNDHYIVNGQKTWISGAEHANWMHTIVRTDPDATKRHKGLTYLMIPMNAQGVTIRSIIATNGRPGWSEIFFEDVKVPVKHRVGDENKGWYVTMATANSERSGGGLHFIYKKALNEILAYCLKTKRGGSRLVDDPTIQEELAEMYCIADMLQPMDYRVVWEQSKGNDVTARASAGKITHTELAHKMNDFIAHRLAGPLAQLRPDSDMALFDGAYELSREVDLGACISVGTNDIHHNIIANRGLRLPTS